MLPHRTVGLDVIPVLPNGKVDRQSLPDPFAAPVPGAAAPGAPAIARPRDEHERILLLRFEEVLGRSDLGVHSNFFAVGGSLLSAARLARRLSREFQRRVPLRVVFEQPTVARLAPAIQALDLAEPPPDEALRALPGRRHAPLTLRQDRIRLHAEIHPASAAYNLPFAQRLAGVLDLAHFKAALAIVIARQPALRTAIRVDPISGDAQTVVDEESDFELPLIDLCGLPAGRRESALDEQLNELADRPIALSRAPLFHAALFRLSAHEHVFAFVPHRLIWDGWSFELLQHELSAAYAAQLGGRPHGLPPLALTPGDHAEWEARWLRSAACRRSRPSTRS